MTSCNNEGRTCKLLKSVMGITMSAAILATNLTCAMAQGNEYPYSSDFPNGIEDADISVFTESEIEYPLNMSFETNEEIEFVKANSQEKQISLSEDAYEGRFALDVKPSSNEKLLVKKTGDFTVGETMVSPAVYSLRTTSADGISVSVDDKQLTVSGVADVNKEVSIILFDENSSIAYVDQINSGAEGIFEFNFMVGDYGTYTMKLGNVGSSAIEQTIVVDDNTADDTITDTTIKVPATVDTKTNIVRLLIKPKYKAESISFYVTAVCGGKEKQLKILGDKDNDGVFKVPDDLALGKWQQITLDLLKLEEVPDSTVVKDFYISANEGSEWVIDSVESEYREINANEVDLEQFAKENVSYNADDGLSFSINSKSETVEYSANPIILTGDMELNKKINGIKVNNAYKKSNDNEAVYVDTNISQKISIDGMKNPIISNDGNKVFYNNTNDNEYIYCYDTQTEVSTKIMEVSKSVYQTTNNGDMIRISGAVYDLKTNTEILLSDARTYELSPHGDIYALVGSKNCEVYKYVDNTFKKVYSYYVSDSYSYTTITCNKYNDLFIIKKDGNTLVLMKNTAEGCVLIKEIELPSDDFKRTLNLIFKFSADGTQLFINDDTIGDKLYYSIYDISSGSIISSSDCDGMLRVLSDGRIIFDEYILDLISGEKEYHNYNLPSVYAYSQERNQIICVEGTTITTIDLNMNTEHNKYLLSFDGKKTWYAYDGGRWVVASVSAEPTLAEMKKSGMTKEEINAIPEEAYAKLYENGNEIYTLNFAIGMFGTTEYITPVVKSITVNTIANQPVDSIYSSKLFTFNKAEYNKVSGVFPVEDFPKVSECYYLLYLGNDWLYTYKDGAVKKLDTSVDKLMEDVNTSWIDIKQAGLNASELRSIPESVLTELFVNEKFANEKFGVIAVSKIKDDSTMDYGVEIKLSAETKYIAEDGYVLEISLNGAEKVVYTPADITKAQIDDFLAWLDERQNGGGNIFYRMQTENNQNFINYYNITNVNVYKESDTTEE
ncbi:MAG: hypothetical protein J6D26_01840 [Clostridia bacterium]|nr:hypothetical protein [Clostridia bacterium]